MYVCTCMSRCGTVQLSCPRIQRADSYVFRCVRVYSLYLWHLCTCILSDTSKRCPASLTSDFCLLTPQQWRQSWCHLLLSVSRCVRVLAYISHFVLLSICISWQWITLCNWLIAWLHAPQAIREWCPQLIVQSAQLLLDEIGPMNPILGKYVYDWSRVRVCIRVHSV